MEFNTGDIVAVYIPGLSRPLYGTVLGGTETTVTVHVESDQGEATMTVDAAIVKPWKEVN